MIIFPFKLAATFRSTNVSKQWEGSYEAKRKTVPLDQSPTSRWKVEKRPREMVRKKSTHTHTQIVLCGPDLVKHKNY